jgi:hypothetical protein
MDKRIVETPEQASAGRKHGIVRYILAISLGLVVIAFMIAYLVVI